MAENFLPEVHDDQKFTCKGYTTAQDDSEIERDGAGQFGWRKKTWQRPVLTLTDISQPPPTSNLGDRYILIGLDNSLGLDSTASVDSGWGTVTENSIVELYDLNLDGTADDWARTLPQDGMATAIRDEFSVARYSTKWGWLNCFYEIHKRITLTPSVLLSIFDNPYFALPRPGVGYATILQKLGGKFIYGGIPYTTDLQIIIKHSSAGNGIQANLPSILGATNSGYNNLPVATAISFSNPLVIENDYMVITTPTANPVSGNSTLILDLFYIIKKL